MPTWPFFSNLLGGRPSPPPPSPQESNKPPSRFLNWVQETLNFTVYSKPRGEWVDPQPLCIRRVEPLEFMPTAR